MKKLIYILLLCAAASVSITACTEQEVTPADAPPAGVGGDPK